MGPRVLGNVLIAVGGILPGIGGSMARNGGVDALFITELVDIILIWGGYTVISGDDAVSIFAARRATQSVPTG